MPFTMLFDQFGGRWDGKQLAGKAGGFAAGEQAKIRQAVKDALEFSTLAKAAADTGFLGKRALLKTWFGADGPATIKAVQQGVNKMHAVFVDGGRVVRFVDARRQSEKLYEHRQVAAPGVAGAHGAMLTDRSEVAQVLPMTASDYAYVKCLSGRDPNAATESHAGSGMRVFLGELMFHQSQSAVDRALTIYHELTHKVLGTKDFGTYGVGPSQALAARNPAQALLHAECWTYFAGSFKHRF